MKDQSGTDVKGSLGSLDSPVDDPLPLSGPVVSGQVDGTEIHTDDAKWTPGRITSVAAPGTRVVKYT